MLRFIPDGWLDALLRPFLLIDSVAGLYTEIHAPDVRFAALVLLSLAGAVFWRRHANIAHGHRQLLAGLTVCFYLWTLVSGNGRYFLWGLLVVGPLIVVAMRQMPVTQAMRNTIIMGVLLMQGLVVAMTFEANAWGLRAWASGPGIHMNSSPLRDKPAAFLTIGAISHSIVVPHMHPDSRWANMAGQHEVAPGSLEYPLLQDLLDGPLPKYLMVRATQFVLGPDRQPLPQARAVMGRAVSRQGLEILDTPCELLETPIVGMPEPLRSVEGEMHGYLFCPVRRSERPSAIESEGVVAPEYDDVFRQVEQRCPRFFPPDSARTRATAGAFLRSYLRSDVNLYVGDSGVVYFKHFRALNPTILAPTEKVRQGEFELDCNRLPGRYVPPWARN